MPLGNQLSCPHQLRIITKADGIQPLSPKAKGVLFHASRFSFYIFECYLTFPFILNWYAHIITLLQVNLYKGLFYFDSRFRPVPLKQTFVGKLFLIQNSCNNYHCGDEHVLVHFILHTCFLGVRGSNKFKTREHMDVACYEKVLESVKNGDQVSTT